MTLLNQLQAHRGGLIRIKSELYWCYGRGWDGVPGRLCLLLDAADANIVTAAVDAPTACTRRPHRRTATATRAAALLLVDGAPRWVWVVAKDIELLDGAPQ